MKFVYFYSENNNKCTQFLQLLQKYKLYNSCVPINVNKNRNKIPQKVTDLPSVGLKTSDNWKYYSGNFAFKWLNAQLSKMRTKTTIQPINETNYSPFVSISGDISTTEIGKACSSVPENLDRIFQESLISRPEDEGMFKGANSITRNGNGDLNKNLEQYKMERNNSLGQVSSQPKPQHIDFTKFYKQ